MRTVRSDSAAVRRARWLRRRVRVRCGMPSLRERTVFATSRRPARAVTEVAGRPLRTSSAKSSAVRMLLPSTLRPPSTSAIDSVPIMASWLVRLGQLAVRCNAQQRTSGGPSAFLSAVRLLQVLAREIGAPGTRVGGDHLLVALDCQVAPGHEVVNFAGGKGGTLAQLRVGVLEFVYQFVRGGRIRIFSLTA